MRPAVLPPHRAQRGAARLAAVLAAALLAAAGAWFALAPSATMPDTTFTSIQGEKIDASSLRGKVVLVNFWATSCVTCVQEMPMMVETYKKYAPQGYEMIAVAMSYDPPNYVLNFAQTRDLPFIVALDPMGAIARSFDDVKLTPTSFLIDKQGRIVKRYLGEPNVAEFHATIEKALAG
ncbi:Thiol-disulfide oxidoreductase ResA [Pigmentiphaga humi]|uniref:Thiol-disulfide oxidoreductase ResA n=1 Tax=Pigmentiphaga humi TaxID=2478468 RepID=A0A3P4B661_9BURK|nr:TlpA disulfide reductase family protein [Pigmentiphaga humi]VCU71803.1 Thiol-disulfide oxidoreductase ResA [Pigmentiphaga humi]